MKLATTKAVHWHEIAKKIKYKKIKNSSIILLIKFLMVSQTQAAAIGNTFPLSYLCVGCVWGVHVWRGQVGKWGTELSFAHWLIN